MNVCHNEYECVQAGNFSKALDLAFSTKQFGALQMISSDLDERADPELLERCANFFIDNGQHDKAVDLLAIGKKVGSGPQSQWVTVVSFETWKQKKVEGLVSCAIKALVSCSSSVSCNSGS